MIPLYHDFEDETVLVFGGGTVGARKARRFAREADVVVVGPSFPADDYGGADRVRGEPTAEDVPDWFDDVDPALVVAATDDDAVNDAVAAEAESRGILHNRADRSGDRAFGSVVVPATIRDGDVVVAVSTSGRSPALAAELRSRIDNEISGAGLLADITGEVRSDLKDRGVDPESRRRAVRAVVESSAVWKDLGTGRSKARQTVNAVVDAALGEQE